MRYNVHKKHSTRYERFVYEVLKSNQIPFKHRWIIGGREIDFVVGNYAIEIDGHEQDEHKNNMLVEHGYTPIHIHNQEFKQNRELITQKLLCLLQDLN